MLDGIETMTHRPDSGGYIYIGTVIKSEEDNCYYGKILDIEATILYEANSKNELYTAFINAIEDYLDLMSKGLKHENK